MAEAGPLYLVDDDPALRSALAMRLRLAGYRVASFASGAGLLGALAEDARGCAVLDLCMPEMDGLELQRALRTRAPGVVVVLLSGDIDAGSLQCALQQGAAAVLQKPISGAALIEVLERALAQGRAISPGSG
ncbi:response regulator transcription factor [Marichromatium bheemlicum]|uniref:Response regulator n=1 Tax=Marichromatium bheemlicum TaxID=365339 RepID=A0ABX1I3K0_9GAMM|nr:response regulator [Marichromatium bheemlicum]NKN32045.1 response regulator [Marichromatium bheemlicum]